MLGGRITLVSVKSIGGIFGMQLHHQLVAMDLGEYRGRRDGRAAPVATDDGLDGAGKTRERRCPVAVDLDPVRSPTQPGKSPGHGQHGRVQDVQRIDFGVRGNADGPVQGTAVNALHQRLALRRAQLLGIADTRKHLAGGQHHGSRDHKRRPAARARPRRCRPR
jgi:hypothetical protein